MFFEDDETLQMYVEESLEHLADIETDLLALEEQGNEVDDELVNNVFRAAHSVKGGAGFMGLDVIKELSHNLENILGLIRDKELFPNPDNISKLLRSFDKLRELISNVETSNDQDIDEFVRDLKSITQENLPESEVEAIEDMCEIKHPHSESTLLASRYDLSQVRNQGKFIYIIEYDLIHDIQKKDKNPLDVINSLLKSGIILDSKIDIASIGTLDDSIPNRIPFIILFASIIEPDMAPILVDLSPEYVFKLSEDQLPAASASGSVPEPQEEPEIEEMPRPVETRTFEEDLQPEIQEEQPIPEPEPVVEKPVQKASPAPKKKEQVKAMKKQDETASVQDEQPGKKSLTSLRVNVNLLDSLMTLAGELVLSRNQLIQGLNSSNQHNIDSASQRIDMITSELQEAIMQTRMQPISNVFNKFTRVVRDLSRTLGKDIVLNLEGKDVELDKTIIEAINDPLTHLVRNSVDHGIESPQDRENSGKSRQGTINLKAYHEAGQVNIEIEDDGGGIDPDGISAAAVKKGVITEQEVNILSEKEKVNLIFAPGFSTAEQITDVSGRGVGMDVVKSNLEKLGGIIDIDSRVGLGTTIKIKLPLTLAIIPSQIISAGNERYAIPQVNLDELLRIPAGKIKEKIEKVGDAAVVRLRGTLLPLIRLSDVLGIERTYTDPETGEEKVDRRTNIADRRSKDLFNPSESSSEKKETRDKPDRRYHSSSAINIAVVSAGTYRYGLIVDQLMDSEEIVVKPLGKHLKGCKGYAGATIMGDGKVALILDVASIAEMSHLSNSSSPSKKLAEEAELHEHASEKLKDHVSLLLFRNAEDEQFAVPLNLVQRIERIKATDIELVGGQRVVQYRGGSLSLHELGEVANVQPLPENDQIEVIVFKLTGREVGLMVNPPVDAVDVVLNIDAETLVQPGIMGSIIINKFTTLMVEVYEFFRTLHPDWYTENEVPIAPVDPETGETGEYKILFAEDSSFFRNQVKTFLQDDGYAVTVAEDGLIAWETISAEEESFDLVLTDLEMPNMDGFELTAKVKTDPRFDHLPVVALTSLAGEEDIAKGKAVGIDDYQIKLDREKLLLALRSYLNN